MSDFVRAQADPRIVLLEFPSKIPLQKKNYYAIFISGEIFV